MLEILIALTTLSAPGPWPATVPYPKDLQLNQDTRSDRHYDELEVLAGVQPAKKRGALIRTYFQILPEGSSQPATTTWKNWEPLLLAKGWKVVGSDGSRHSLSRTEAGKTIWLDIRLADFDQPLVGILTEGTSPEVLKLSPPAAKLGPVSESKDWPFLPRFPGSTLTGSGVQDQPWTLTFPGDTEETLIAEHYTLKSYRPPPSLSRLETQLSYAEALKKAGWEVLPLVENESSVIGHYAKDGHNLWAAVGRAADDGDSGLSISLADLGATDWGQALDKECRIALIGVHFDFDKSTLRADSAPVLEKALAAIKARPKLKLEIQGHTDSVGDPGHNQTLSEARAASVRSWLVDKGAPAANLSARGFGKNHPIADNDSPAGRAKNRRVELACQK
ncbi:MAG: OmpA family protein [Myxococcota bacterium]